MTELTRRQREALMRDAAARRRLGESDRYAKSVGRLGDTFEDRLFRAVLAWRARDILVKRGIRPGTSRTLPPIPEDVEAAQDAA